MNLLLDTHSFIWFMEGSTKLSKTARALIEDPDNITLLSVVSLWEIAIKDSVGRLNLDKPFASLVSQILDEEEFDLLRLEVPHILMVNQLPLHHRDPFDRMLVAQALVEQVSVVSIDPAFDAYGVTRLW